MNHSLPTLLRKGQRIIGSWLLAAMMATPALAQSNTCGLPDDIQEGNILHCFDWTMSDVKSELANIAAAGFGAVQLSPLQRAVGTTWTWYDAYRPYDFKFTDSAFGTASDLKALCSAADQYGIKVIVDVVFNHVDSKGYHDTWWDSNGRTRYDGDINYGSRYSVTHGQLGGASGYPDVNSEDSEVAARAKAYIEELKSYGVDGIRFDAAKHIALPSEGCNFWSTVCSVSGMYYYGEILDSPGSDALMKEYTRYMSVTDNGYGDGARNAGGTPSSYAGWGSGTISQDKCVYWGESHDTYANNNGASKYVSQDVVDRAYAIVACRKSETALYLSRPSSTEGTSIKCGQKGSTHYTEKCVAEVNKFRNAMVGKADYYTVSNGVACVTRQGGGAVIVKNGGGGNVSITNGGGYVPAGTYTDRVSGNTFTVTSSNISGTVGSTGIAVIYDASSTPVTPTPTPSTGSITVYCQASSAPNLYVWTSTSTSTNGAWPGNKMTSTKQIGGKTFYYATFNESAINIIFNNGSDGDANKTADITGITSDVYYVYDGASTATVYTGDTSTDGGSEGSPSETTSYYCYFNNTANWSKVYVWAWDSSNANCTSASKYPGEQLTIGSDGYYKWTATSGTPSGIIFNDGNGTKAGGGDLTFVNGKVYDANGNTSNYTTGGSGEQGGSGSGSGTITVYCKASTAPNLYVWNSTSTDINGAWPGTKMTSTKAVGGVTFYYASFDAETINIIFNNGSSQTGNIEGITADVYYVYDGGTTATVYTGGNVSDPDESGSGDYPTALYLVGNVNSWSTSTAIEAKGSNGVYTWENVNLPDAGGADAGSTFFSFLTTTGANWDAVNQADRYGASTKDASLSSSATISLFAVGVNASLSYSWKATPGTYTIEANLKTMTVTLKTSRSTLLRNISLTPDDNAPMYNLAGQRVSSSYRGIIIQNGRKFLKK